MAIRARHYINWFHQVVLSRVSAAIVPVLYVMAFVWRRLLFRTTVIAVTGSVGKTTTKECLAEILASQARTYRSWRNRGAAAVAPQNFLRVRPWHRYAVIEVAVGGPGEMAPAARLLRPDVVIILNALATHTDKFKDAAQHAREKGVLLRYLKPGGAALLGREDPQIAPLAEGRGGPVHFFGLTEDCDYRAEMVSALWPERLGFLLRSPSGTREVRTQLVGTHWVSAALAALAAADSVGVPLSSAISALGRVTPFPGRLQPVRVPSGAIFLRDDYGAPLVTAEPAIQVMKTAVAERRWLVLSNVTSTDMSSSVRFRYLAELLRGAAEIVVLIGSKTNVSRRRVIEAGYDPANVYRFGTAREAAELLGRELRPGDLVLLKGRISAHLARICLAQLGPVACWKDRCSKRMLCDICWELGMRAEDLARGEVVVPSGGGTSRI